VADAANAEADAAAVMTANAEAVDAAKAEAAKAAKVEGCIRGGGMHRKRQNASEERGGRQN
jgi:hypothetical protein